MNCNQQLDLPNPLIGSWVIEQINDLKHNRIKTKADGFTYFDNKWSMLNPELLEKFSKLGLSPCIMLVFGHPTLTNFQNTSHIVHADLVWHNNQWKKQPFSINWELSDTDAILHWWNVMDDPEFYPQLAGPFRPDELATLYGQGVLFGKKFTTIKEHSVLSPPYELIDQIRLPQNQAVAINTSIPHSVNWTVREQPRFSLSIRFPLNQIPSWNEGIRLFTT